MSHTELVVGKRKAWVDLSEFEFDEPLLPSRVPPTVTLEGSTVNSFFQCPVCLGVIKTTSTVMACLHRFCHSCIRDSLRLGKKECPKCRVKVTTHRDLRPDEQFDKLIETILGDVEKHEEKEEQQVQQINEKINRAALQESYESGLRRQRRAVRKLGDIPIKLYDSEDERTQPRRKPFNVTLELRSRGVAGDNELQQLQRRYVTTSSAATILNVKQFLVQQLRLPLEPTALCISRGMGAGQSLDDAMSLRKLLASIAAVEDHHPCVLCYWSA